MTCLYIFDIVVVEYRLGFEGVLWIFHEIDKDGEVIGIEADRGKPGGC